jgi:hypothetical protein
MKNIAFCAAALLLQVEPLGASQSQVGGGSTRAPAVRAQTDLLNAMSALGTPQALRAAQFLHVEQTGSTFAGEQGRLPSELVAEARRVYRWYFDSAGKRALRDAEQYFPGGIRFWTRAAASPQGAWSVDVAKWRDGTDLQTLPQAGAIASLAQFQRFLPHLMLAQAQEASAGLEAGEGGGLRYKDAAGSLIQVTLDPQTNLPLRASQIVDGKPAGETVYSDYELRHGLMMPGRVQVFQAGILREDLKQGR